MKKQLAKQCIEAITAIGGFMSLQNSEQALSGLKTMSNDLDELTKLAYSVLHEKEPCINLYVDDKEANKQFLMSL